MTIKDIHGHALSGADANAAEHYEAACALLRCYLNDPLAEAQAALAQAPDMTMAHVLVAYLEQAKPGIRLGPCYMTSPDSSTGSCHRSTTTSPTRT